MLDLAEHSVERMVLLVRLMPADCISSACVRAQPKISA